MFGFLRSARGDIAYRRAYARLCRLQHSLFGASTLPLLSYEAVFLYLLLTDAGACSGPPADTPRCCRLQASRNDLRAPDVPQARFCAAFGLLLASVKLDDDVRDDRSLAARLVRWKLRKAFGQARGYMASLDASFSDQVQQAIQDHLRLERADCERPLEEYAKPTADAFGYVFDLAARVLGGEHTARHGWMEAVGRCIGAAIIAFDCAVDWRQDRVRGQYNPLPDAAAVDGAWLACQRYLAEAAWTCFDHAGAGAQTVRVLRSRFDSLASPVCHSPPRKRIRPWRSFGGYTRKALARSSRGDCDCGGCDGCDAIDCGGQDSNCGCAEKCDGSDCGCVACDCCPLPEGRKSKKRRGEPTANQSGPPNKIHLVGHALTALDPSGVAVIGGRRFPARTTGRVLAADTPIRAVGGTSAGLLVTHA